jgi:hypothetical protein
VHSAIYKAQLDTEKLTTAANFEDQQTLISEKNKVNDKIAELKTKTNRDDALKKAVEAKTIIVSAQDPTHRLGRPQPSSRSRAFACDRMYSS